MKVMILQDIDSNFNDKKKGHKVNYALKGQTLNAIQRNDESLLASGTKEKFILFLKDENKKFKICQ
jgi:hypothetical protein